MYTPIIYRLGKLILLNKYFHRGWFNSRVLPGFVSPLKTKLRHAAFQSDDFTSQFYLNHIICWREI